MSFYIFQIKETVGLLKQLCCECKVKVVYYTSSTIFSRLLIGSIDDAGCNQRGKLTKIVYTQI